MEIYNNLELPSGLRHTNNDDVKDVKHDCDENMSIDQECPTTEHIVFHIELSEQV